MMERTELDCLKVSEERNIHLKRRRIVAIAKVLTYTVHSSESELLETRSEQNDFISKKYNTLKGKILIFQESGKKNPGFFSIKPNL
jgi:hypothetical protein